MEFLFSVNFDYDFHKEEMTAHFHVHNEKGGCSGHKEYDAKMDSTDFHDNFYKDKERFLSVSKHFLLKGN